MDGYFIATIVNSYIYLDRYPKSTSIIPSTKLMV